MPVVIKPDDDVSVFAQSLASDKVCPIFTISNVSGEGIPKLKEFLSMLTSRILISGYFKKPSDPVEFLIDGIYQVTGVGLVVAGTLRSGTVVPNTTLQLGPDKSGGFK
jgi:GTPase